MHVILSPSKLQTPNFVPRWPIEKRAMSEETKEILTKLQAYTYEALGQMMKIKGPLLDQTYETLNGGQTLEGHAITTYTGLVYKEIDIHQYAKPQLDYLSENISLLSALYGPLSPMSVIKPYRLDMTMKPGGINLYHHWQAAVDLYFKDCPMILNLASLEFSKMIDPTTFKGEMIDVYFKEEQADGDLKIVTVRTKQARGLMAHYMIDNRLTSLDQIKHFSEAGYTYADTLSSASKLVFVKPYE